VSCFAEHTVCAEQAVLKIPEEVPMPIAAVVGCAVMTGVGAVVNTARVEPGSTLLVIGAGGVGLCAIMGAVLAGAARIIAADVNPAKLGLATSFGATDVVDSWHEDVVDAVRELTGGGVDYAFEVIGLTRTVEQAVRAVRVGGTAVAVGIVPTHHGTGQRPAARHAGEDAQGLDLGIDPAAGGLPTTVRALPAGAVAAGPTADARVAAGPDQRGVRRAPGWDGGTVCRRAVGALSRTASDACVRAFRRPSAGP
jgi:Zn-dependent alcohol dehydrogenase